MKKLIFFIISITVVSLLHAGHYDEMRRIIPEEVLAESFPQIAKLSPQEYIQWYHVLNVDPGADEATIKKAYKKLSLKFHPDKNKAEYAGTVFNNLNDAQVKKSDNLTRDKSGKLPIATMVLKLLPKKLSAGIIITYALHKGLQTKLAQQYSTKLFKQLKENYVPEIHKYEAIPQTFSITSKVIVNAVKFGTSLILITLSVPLNFLGLPTYVNLTDRSTEIGNQTITIDLATLSHDKDSKMYRATDYSPACKAAMELLKPGEKLPPLNFAISEEQLYSNFKQQYNLSKKISCVCAVLGFAFMDTGITGFKDSIKQFKSMWKNIKNKEGRENEK